MRCPPPRDDNGRILPHDHPEVTKDHHTIRHTIPNDLHVESPTYARLAGGAFSESSDGGMSCDEENWVTDAGLHALHYVTEPTHRAVRLNVGALRELGFQVGWDPDRSHEHHVRVSGIGNGSRQKKKMRCSPRRCASCEAKAKWDHVVPSRE
jgi:hypothetical protein